MSDPLTALVHKNSNDAGRITVHDGELRKTVRYLRMARWLDDLGKVSVLDL